jgi:hypothetical protein
MKQSPNSEYKDSPGIFRLPMIHIVEEIKLLLLYNLLYIYIYIYNWLMYVVGVIEDWDN